MEEAKYSIKDLEHFTQIKAHTIRIWEQRYGLLSPQRTSTNIRYYNDDDLKKILNINILYLSGWKISKIAKLTTLEISKEAEKAILSDSKKINNDVNDTMIDIMTFDHKSLINKLEKHYDTHGMIELYETIIRPALVRIGELWQVNTIQVVNEHFFSAALREFIISKQLQLPPTTGTKKAILFLHQHEEHELGLLLQRFILTLNNVQVCYLGSKLPLEQLPAAINQLNPQYLVTSYISTISEKTIIEQLNSLRSISKGEIIISGNQAEKHSKMIGNGFRIVHSLHEFDQLIKNS